MAAWANGDTSAPQSSSSGQCIPGFSKRSSPMLDKTLCFHMAASTFPPSSTPRHSSAQLGRNPPPGQLAHLYFKLTSDMHFDTAVPPLSFPHYLALFRACFFFHCQNTMTVIINRLSQCDSCSPLKIRLNNRILPYGNFFSSLKYFLSLTLVSTSFLFFFLSFLSTPSYLSPAS